MLFANTSLIILDPEKNYSQIKKEGLAIVFALKQFQRLITGRDSTLHTDHRPFLKIVRPNDSVPSTKLVRLQRWVILHVA